MSVTTETSRALFTGNGGTADFATGFYFRLSSELVVTLTPSGGTPVIQTEGVHYSVVLCSDIGQPDGEVTMAVAPPAASELKVERTVPFVQASAFRQAGEFDPASHEDQFDEVVFQTQQLHRRVSDIEDGSLTGTFVAGNGLSMAATTLNVGAGAGIQSNANDVEVVFGVLAELQLVSSDAAPLTGVEGTVDKAARIDHQHMAVTGAPVALTVGGANAVGAAFTLSRADHVHAAAVGAPVAVDAAAAVTGASGNFSDAAHKHQVSVGSPVQVATANADGVANSLARSDHAHAHGAQLGGTTHADATAGASGFMPAAIFAPLNGVKQSKTHVRAWQAILQAIPHFTVTTIICDTEDYDTDAEYDNATGIFTAKNDGYYLVSAGVNLAAALWAAGNSVSLAVFRNAVAQGGSPDVIDAALNRATTARAAFGIFLATGDTLKATVIHNQGGPVNTVAARSSTWLTIDRVL